MRISTRVLLSLFALAWLELWSPAQALTEETSRGEEEQLSRARELFRQGVELADQGDRAAAAGRFEQALELHQASTIRYNLATIYAQLGRHLEAAEQLDLILVHDEADAALRTQAQTLLGEVEAHLGRLAIDRGTLDSRAQLTLDGQPLAAEQLAHPLRVRTGHHSVVATLEGEEVARHELEVSAGHTAAMTLIPTPHLEDPLFATPPESEERPLVRDWRLWVGVGAAVVALALALGVALTVGDHDEYEDPVQGTMTPGVLTWP